MKTGFFPMLEKKRLLQPCWLLFAAFLLVIPASSFGQGYFGTVTGVLTDPTGAVIPGAKVTLIDQEKGYKFNATSDEPADIFSVPFLPAFIPSLPKCRASRRPSAQASAWT